MKKKLYIDSSVISVLTARPSNDIQQLSLQLSTQDLWSKSDTFDFYVSFLVLREIGDGDEVASGRRLEAVRGMQVLLDHTGVAQTANTLIKRHAVPAAARADAVHIAIAAHYNMDYLLTYNHKHINNPTKAVLISSTLADIGLIPPIITRPDIFLEVEHG